MKMAAKLTEKNIEKNGKELVENVWEFFNKNGREVVEMLSEKLQKKKYREN